MRQKKEQKKGTRCIAEPFQVFRANTWRRALAVLAAQVPEEPEIPGRALTPVGPTGRGGYHHAAECQLACPKCGWLL